MKERLTKILQCDDGNKLYGYSDVVVRNVKDFSTRLEMIFQKLAEYENLEEQGLILRLPCKIGDVVYKIITRHDNFDDTPYRIVSAVNFRLDMLDEIGKEVFLTKSEAEKNLKKNRKNIFGEVKLLHI